MLSDSGNKTNENKVECQASCSAVRRDGPRWISYDAPQGIEHHHSICGQEMAAGSKAKLVNAAKKKKRDRVRHGSENKDKVTYHTTQYCAHQISTTKEAC